MIIMKRDIEVSLSADTVRSLEDDKREGEEIAGGRGGREGRTKGKGKMIEDIREGGRKAKGVGLRGGCQGGKREWKRVTAVIINPFNI